MSKKVVMALSGGMDSGTMLAYLIDKGYEVHCLNFTYGSKHNQYEIQCAEKLANYYKVPYRLIDLTEAFNGFKSNLLLTGDEIPEGHYASPIMSKTVVPGRNTIFASILMGYAESIDAKYIALGVHQGNHFIYSDCRAEYIKALDTLVYLASERKVEVVTPFGNTDKIGICKIGLELGVPYTLTRTCYKDQENACGKCPSCVERLEAFEKNHEVDPAIYDDDMNLHKTKKELEQIVHETADKIINDNKEECSNIYKTIMTIKEIPDSFMTKIKNFFNNIG